MKKTEELKEQPVTFFAGWKSYSFFFSGQVVESTAKMNTYNSSPPEPLKHGKNDFKLKPMNLWQFLLL
jgi:hypothetical protein